MYNLPPAFKDKLIFLGWIAGLVLVISLIWSFSFPYRATRLMRSANRALAAIEDKRQISAILPRQHARPALLGCWYSLKESDSIFYIFVIMREGVFVPCGVEINKDGKAVDIVPLGGHARQVFIRIPQGLVQVYIQRIESIVSAGRS
jgi:hypothetical protein